MEAYAGNATSKPRDMATFFTGRISQIGQTAQNLLRSFSEGTLIMVVFIKGLHIKITHMLGEVHPLAVGLWEELYISLHTSHMSGPPISATSW